ncbi:unnamed protein product [Sphagnum jensenii]|uniref:Uncharacterized protein n=2 Tax=Sphagnum jensenii TaxID=128206 RepID=A0ABP1A061_9BRYO
MCGRGSDRVRHSVTAHRIGHRNFRIFALADAAFFTSIALITGGLLYYVKAMLLLPEAIGTAMLAVMVLVTLALYPGGQCTREKDQQKEIDGRLFLLYGICIWLYLLVGALPHHSYITSCDADGRIRHPI